MLKVFFFRRCRGFGQRRRRKSGQFGGEAVNDLLEGAQFAKLAVAELRKHREFLLHRPHDLNALDGINAEVDFEEFFEWWGTTFRIIVSFV